MAAPFLLILFLILPSFFQSLSKTKDKEGLSAQTQLPLVVVVLPLDPLELFTGFLLARLLSFYTSCVTSQHFSRPEHAAIVRVECKEGPTNGESYCTGLASVAATFHIADNIIRCQFSSQHEGLQDLKPVLSTFEIVGQRTSVHVNVSWCGWVRWRDTVPLVVENVVS